MQITDLETLDLSKGQEARSAEAQIAGAFDAFGAKASDPALTALLHGEVPEAAGHRDALAEVIAAHDAAPRAHADRKMRAMLDEADRWAGAIEDAGARDAARGASAQRGQHDEIARHCSLVARAKPLGMRDRSRLEAIVAAEKEADARLTEIAEAGVTTEAA
ncbi:DUF892 family protein [Rhodosalinus sediminis]|uniref:DUF892 family protein n=1 Tax=Rhodosalinus sediminis TaxID=1940533 RepID=A0A3D9BZD6_9RHOB|nr:DUF892 family protein [Rhodosalinus sediminis]REC58746.1 DUF892 family protein [Rhodosalinus sediminis]